MTVEITTLTRQNRARRRLSDAVELEPALRRLRGVRHDRLVAFGVSGCSRMSRAFKLWNGQTPGQYRNGFNHA